MPETINRAPPGLLSLLGVPSFGRNPSFLADQVVPTLDLRTFYQSVYCQEAINTITAPAAVGQHVSNLAGPGPGEIWLVERMSLYPTVALPVGTTYANVCPIYVDAGSGVAHYLDTGTLLTVTATQQGIIGSSGFVLPTNCRLGMYVGGVTLGTATAWYCSTRYVSLRV